MSAWTPPFGFGEKSPFQSPAATFFSLTPPPSLARDLGKKWMINGNEYKLIQTTVAFTAPNIQSLWVLDAGTNTKSHTTAATVNAVVATNTLAGLASPSQVALVANDFFLVQTAGRATVISGGTTTAVAQTTGAAGRTLDMVAPAALANVAASIATFVGVAHQTVAAASSFELDMQPIA
jgi:hypothetical protein